MPSSVLLLVLGLTTVFVAATLCLFSAIKRFNATNRDAGAVICQLQRKQEPHLGFGEEFAEHADSEMRVRFGDRESAPLEVEMTDLPPFEQLTVIRLPGNEDGMFSDAFIKLAKLFQAGIATGTLKLRFSAEGTRQLRNGQLELMRSAIGERPIAYDPASGRAREIGHLVKGLNTAAAVAL